MNNESLATFQSSFKRPIPNFLLPPKFVFKCRVLLQSAHKQNWPPYSQLYFQTKEKGHSF